MREETFYSLSCLFSNRSQRKWRSTFVSGRGVALREDMSDTQRLTPNHLQVFARSSVLQIKDCNVQVQFPTKSLLLCLFSEEEAKMHFRCEHPSHSFSLFLSHSIQSGSKSPKCIKRNVFLIYSAGRSLYLPSKGNCTEKVWNLTRQ